MTHVTGDTGGQHCSLPQQRGTLDAARIFPRVARQPARSAGDRAARVRFRRADRAHGDDPRPARLRPARRRQPAGRPGRDPDLVRPGRGTCSRFAIGLLWHGFAFSVGTNTPCSACCGPVLMLLAIGWAALFMDAWRIGQPLTLAMQHRRAVVGVNGCSAWRSPVTLLFGAAPGRRPARLHHHDVRRRGGRRRRTHGRYNVLLLGGDSGAGRWGLRPDSMTDRQHRRGDRQDRARSACRATWPTSRSPRAR